ncbi:L-threonylcarbamoyladenylate synthase [Breznakia blatticola]|uniref:L-threonylcarbamoyladenylate synthase n=1 Tax=Breznakia blatticola TaxID=1754012 RepID=A0A4R7ZBM4_9FIRM|nr:L-threonylcarbamoyladenylate synthase [Breznakia blatticola]TDW14542.1 L-threonylcarbamoyladenylate synthase [Breznakia blatticola]
MKTKIFTTAEIKEIKDYIYKGKVIAFPTDTVFGVGVRYGNPDALEALKQAKDRDRDKPIPTMVKDLQQIKAIANVDWKMDALYKHFMPGALTVIVNKKEEIPAYVSDGKPTIAIRIPDDAFVLDMLEEGPMLVTSANMSGQTPGKDETEVLQQLDGRIDAIVIGQAKENVASTIVDLTGEEVRVVREGKYSLAQIQAVLQEEQK